MTNIVDRRFSPKDGAINNRQKFIKRYKNSIKKAVRDILDTESIKDFKFKDKKIRIRATDDEDSLNIPHVHNDSSDGVYDHVHVGNKKYSKGQEIPKPEKGNKKGKGGSNKGGDNDDFEFTLTEEEFANIFFEDLELPEMIKKRFTGDSYEIQRAGYSNTGGPSSLNLKQTIIRAFTRRKALQSQADKQDEAENNDKKIGPEGAEMELTKRRKRINFLEETDLRFNYRDRVDVPTTKAVMVALMDVSGSMGEKEKDIAKRFFMLLGMFLKTNYSAVDIVFVRHAEWAEECDEETFFHGRESGGTVISTGYAKINEILQARYNPELWNIYIAQATDGDNFDYDNDEAERLLVDCLLPVTQYFAYIEIGDKNCGSRVFRMLERVGQSFKKVQARLIDDYKEIFEVFRSLFKKEK